MASLNSLTIGLGLIATLATVLASRVIVKGPSLNIVAASGGGGSGQSTNYLSPTAYYRFDETNDMDRMFDVVGSNHFTNYAISPTSITGHITNAYEFTSGPLETVFERPLAGAWNFGDTNFAIRFWVKTSGDSGDEFFFANDDSTDGFRAFFNGISPTNHHVQWEVDNGGSYASITSTNILTSGSWHRIVFWHKTGVELGMKLDNATSETLSYTNTLNATTANVSWASGATSSDPIIRFDELSIWNGYVPTESELLYDWNSGAGRGYPLE